jgi:hypothetical protein
MPMNGFAVFTLLLFVLIPGVPVDGQEAQSDTLPDSRILTITGVGDVMMGTAFPSGIYLPPGNDPKPLLKSVREYLEGSDLVFANLEGPFSDYNELAKRCKDTTRCYAFRVPEEYVSVFHDAGFNLVSLANNHIGDFGPEGRNRTIRLFDSLGIKYAGLLDYPYSIFCKDSVVYGFVAFSPNKGTLNITDIGFAESLVAMLDDTCDVVIVSFHGGAEGAEYQNITRETESFYGENRGNVYEFSHRVIDAGADIVFGHGPHVTRAIELYKNRIIAYSLGNFCTYRRFNLSGPNGFAPVLKVKTDLSGNFVEADIIPVYQDNMGHVKYDPQKRAIKKIIELVAEDFPDSGISISSDGNVKYKQ